MTLIADPNGQPTEAMRYASHLVVGAVAAVVARLCVRTGERREVGSASAYLTTAYLSGLLRLRYRAIPSKRGALVHFRRVSSNSY